MRITSGIFRGRKLVSPNSETTHPMGDREKLALFNSLGDSIKGAVVLDLFAGSGALGLEALSRGAKDIDFVENSRKAVLSIKSNISALEVSNSTNIFVQDVKVFLDYALANPKKYDIILIDPPYDKFEKFFNPNTGVAANKTNSGSAGQCAHYCASAIFNLSELLSPEGKIVLSHPGLVPPANLFSGLKLISSRKYARANISIYERA